MKMKYFFLLIITITTSAFAIAQKKKTDSIAVVKSFQQLLNICKDVNFADPKTTSSGLFYKAAPYIIYRGDDKKRAWKTFANYNAADEKKGVDEICTRINETVNRDTNFTIVQYRTEKESEGTWHLLMVTFVKEGREKKGVFAFLKIGRRFGLGDID